MRFVDERIGRTISLTGVDLMASFAGPVSPFAAHGYVLWNRQRVAMTLFIKDPARIPGQGSPIDVTLDSPLLKFSFSGRAVLNHQASLSGTAELATPSVRDLSGWTGFRLGSGRGLGPLAASGPFDLTNGVLSLTKTVMALDGMNGQGNIKIDFTGDKPRVTAALGMDRLDLNAYAGSADRRQASQAAGDDDWSDGELDFAPLRALEAKLSLAVSELRLGGVQDRQGQHCRRAGGRRSRPVRQRRRALWRQGIGPPGPQRLAPGSGLAGRHSRRERRGRGAARQRDWARRPHRHHVADAVPGGGGPQPDARSSRPCAARRSSAWSMARCATSTF